MTNCRCNSQNNNMNYDNYINNNSNNLNSTFNRSGAFPNNYLYGHAYTPNQIACQTFTPEVGLSHGSIFPELVSSYVPGQSIDFIEYLKNGGCR